MTRVRRELHTLKKRVHLQLTSLFSAGRYASRRFRNLTKRPSAFDSRDAAWRGVARRGAARRGAAAVAANISSSCCTAGDRARTKGRVTKTTYIFSTQFQTLKGKRDLPAGPASIIPSTNTMVGPPSRYSSCADVVREALSRRCAHILGSMCY